MSILVVDDDHKALLAIARPLRKLGYEVTEAFKAEQVVSAAENGEFAVAIIDIFMPGMGGIEAIQRIHAKSPKCRIIAITEGFADIAAESAIVAAKRIGAEAGFVKPVAIDDLMALISDWLPAPLQKGA